MSNNNSNPYTPLRGDDEDPYDCIREYLNDDLSDPETGPSIDTDLYDPKIIFGDRRSFQTFVFIWREHFIQICHFSRMAAIMRFPSLKRSQAFLANLFATSGCCFCCC